MTLHRRISLRTRFAAAPESVLPAGRARSRRTALIAVAQDPRRAATPKELIEAAVALVNDASRELVLSAEVQHELDAALGRIVRIFAKPTHPLPTRRVVDAGEPGAHAGGAAPPDPLQEARERGRLAAAREWERPENLSLKDAALYAGRSDRAINQDRQAGRLYALVLPGRERGYRYPSWQFHVDSERLAGVLAPFVAARASSWVVHNFLHRPQEGLAGRTPADWIADATAPIDAVVRLVDARYRDEQGTA
ncbi:MULTISPECIES: hypothetical protein [unclassified Cupriavidus]|uniref:hypothetical protein n=1 Tax=unclassified Cupriavidus TaxID=2640874 RepID=UPI0012EB0561|nr:MULTISPECIES: hypothetical protein [unclassified Cupriavidus]MBP0633019.1 hypothetical protein [Cupriavidus sp. AcVe19-1a]